MIILLLNLRSLLRVLVWYSSRKQLCKIKNPLGQEGIFAGLLFYNNSYWILLYNSSIYVRMNIY
jgi:hypothetical protein